MVADTRPGECNALVGSVNPFGGISSLLSKDCRELAGMEGGKCRGENSHDVLSSAVFSAVRDKLHKGVAEFTKEQNRAH